MSERRKKSIFAIGAWYYFLASVVLFLTMPLSSHSNNWSGIFPGFLILMYGAYRLAQAGIRLGWAFVYGCGTSFLFFMRFLSMGRFSLWVAYQAPSTPMLALRWISICLFLGTAASAVVLITRIDRPKIEDD